MRALQQLLGSQTTLVLFKAEEERNYILPGCKEVIIGALMGRGRVGEMRSSAHSSGIDKPPCG